MQIEKKKSSIYGTVKINGFNSVSEVEDILKFYRGQLNKIEKNNPKEFLDLILIAKAIKNAKTN